MHLLKLTSSVSRNAGGLFESVRRLAQEVAAAGVNVDVVGVRDEFTDEDLSRWAPIKPYVFAPMRSLLFLHVPGVSGQMDLLSADIVHCHGLWDYSSIASMNWAARAGKPYIVSPRGMLDEWALRNSRIKKIIAGFLFEKAHLKKATCIHALCESEAKSIRAYGIKNPICVIPNGVNIPENIGPCDSPWQDKIPDGAKVLLCLGRIHPKKGLSLLIKAWSDLQKEKAADDWHLAIAGWGSGDYESVLRKMVDESGVKDRVHFVGPKFGSAKDAVFRSADAFVLPSFSEGLPMAVLEAWSYGLPVLMTPQCNISEGFMANAALRIDPEQGSIRKGLTDMMDMTDNDRREMGCRGVDLVRKSFLWSDIAERMIEVYKWILGDGTLPESVRLK